MDHLYGCQVKRGTPFRPDCDLPIALRAPGRRRRIGSTRGSGPDRPSATQAISEDARRRVRLSGSVLARTRHRIAHRAGRSPLRYEQLGALVGNVGGWTCETHAGFKVLEIYCYAGASMWELCWLFLRLPGHRPRRMCGARLLARHLPDARMTPMAGSAMCSAPEPRRRPSARRHWRAPRSDRDGSVHA
jgi:hypothetical protein